jgi:chorismate dehydratase
MIGQGEVDIALASSFFALERPELAAAPASGISSQGYVESVRLFSKKPFDQIESLALDESSMTSNALVQILLRERYGSAPDASPLPPSLHAMLAERDAAVLIGDSGMSADAEGLHVLDLGAVWNEMTGLPFVWALWIGRPERVTPELIALLKRAKRFGSERIEDVARAESERLDITYSRALRYLVEVIDYELTDRHWAGLAHYAVLCRKHGFIGADTMPPIVGEAHVG